MLKQRCNSGAPFRVPRWGDEPASPSVFTGIVSSVIDYLCASQEHQLPEDAASPVLVYDDGWAYCPAGAATGHDWRATGGRTLATVRDLLRRPAPVIS